MRDETEFTVTHEHLKLARRMHVGWIGDEYGAPEINPKRPYGNSDVVGDMLEILERPEEEAEDMRPLHEDMETVLQIALSTGEFKAGRYVREPYRATSWRLA